MNSREEMESIFNKKCDNGEELKKILEKIDIVKDKIDICTVSGNEIVQRNSDIIREALKYSEEKRKIYHVELMRELIKNLADKMKSDILSSISENGINMQTKNYPSGYSYEAQVSDGQLNGWGTEKYKDGSSYQGEFKDGKRHGKGISTHACGDIYIGDNNNNRRHGMGIYIFNKGQLYIGEWKDGHKNGHGIYITEKYIYEGLLFNGYINGHGIYITEEYVYEGEFKESKFCGNGLAINLNGEIFTGEYKEGKSDGDGIFIYLYGACTKGTLINNEKHGKFVYINSNGTREYHEWENDVKKEKCDIDKNSACIKDEIIECNEKEDIKYSTDKALPGKKSQAEASCEKDYFSNLIGLNNIKEKFNELSNSAKVYKLREKMGIKSIKPGMNFIFNGNTGTGKTTSAKIIADLYKDLEILEKGHVVEIKSSNIEKISISEKVKEALGGILLIKEVDALCENNKIDDLLKLIEENEENLAVILSGKDMDTLLNSNKELKSKFNTVINFEDFSENELLEIMKNKCDEYAYTLTDKAEEQLINIFRNEKEKEDFKNTVFVEEMLEEIIKIQSSRIIKMSSPTKEEIMGIEEEDIDSYINN